MTGMMWGVNKAGYERSEHREGFKGVGGGSEGAGGLEGSRKGGVEWAGRGSQVQFFKKDKPQAKKREVKERVER